MAANSFTTTNPVLNLIRAVVRGECPHCRVLLSLRMDYFEWLTRVGLPPLDGANHFTVEPFDATPASAFLRGGFESLGDDILNPVLAETAALDDITPRVRPITLNMVGLMLRALPSGNRFSVGRRPFANHIRQLLLQRDVKATAPHILRFLIDDQHQRVSLSVAQLSEATGINCDRINACLTRLSVAGNGLVRCLNPIESNIPLRVWEVAHDFVANLLGNILPGFLPGARPNLWRLLRPWLAPVALVLWFAALFIALPYIQKRERDAVIARLSTEFGLQVIQVHENGDLMMRLEPMKKRTSIADGIPLLKQLGTVSELDASGCEELADVNGLNQLTTLRHLNLQDCEKLISVDGLKGLPTLTTLNLHGCKYLSNVDGLKGLPALITLDLSRGVNLSNLDGLKGLPALTTLTLTDCNRLTSMDGLKGLPALNTLHIYNCDKLTNLDVLRGLPALTTFTIGGCENLSNVDGLKRLPALTTLYLDSCYSLTGVDGLKGLLALTDLSLFGCNELTNVDGLKGLPALTRLDLRMCDNLSNLDGLKGLPALTKLDLGGCNKLTHLNELTGLSTLTTLRLVQCKNLSNLDGLKGLTALTTLDLGECEKLTDVEGLESVLSLRLLTLSKNHRLNLDSLRKKCPNLKIEAD